MNGKKVLMWLLVIFVIYAIFTAPTKAANVTGGAINLTLEGLHSVGVFFDRLLEVIPT
jgi:hypothetical protein